MMLYKNMKIKVFSPDGNTDYFDIVVGVLKEDTLAPLLFIIYLDNMLWSFIDLMKENGFKLANEWSRRYPTQTITDADDADDIALIANTFALAETLLHSLEWAASGIGLHINADKTEYMCINQRGDISTIKGGPLKLVDKFTYLGSSVSSTDNDINTRLAKAWTVIDRKSDLIDKIKRSLYRAAVMSILQYGCTTWMLKCGEKAWRQLHKKVASNIELVKKKAAIPRTNTHTKTIQVRSTRHAGHCWRSGDELISDVLTWTLSHGRAKAGGQAQTYIQQLCADTGCSIEDLPGGMEDRDG